MNLRALEEKLTNIFGYKVYYDEEINKFKWTHFEGDFYITKDGLKITSDLNEYLTISLNISELEVIQKAINYCRENIIEEEK